MSSEINIASPPLLPTTQADIARILGEYCFIRLDNGDEAFFYNGYRITGAVAASREDSVMGLARRMARAGRKSLRCVDLPVPDDREWSWDDVVVQLVRCAATRNLCGEPTVTCCRLQPDPGYTSAATQCSAGPITTSGSRLIRRRTG